MPIEVGFAGSECRLDVGGPRFLEVVYLGEPFTLEKLLGHILWGLTDTWDLHQSDRRCLQSWLRTDYLRSESEDTCCARQYQTLKKLSPGTVNSVLATHDYPPYND